MRSMLKGMLEEKRERILKRWLELILETYPADTRNFLRNHRNQFTNPVGHALVQGLSALYEQLSKGEESPGGHEAVERLVRIRAVQDMPPSQALGFIPALKEILREELGSFIVHDPERIRELEAGVDRMALMAFDVYSRCREQLYEIHVRELRSRTERLLKMAGLVYELAEEHGEIGSTEGLPEG